MTEIEAIKEALYHTAVKELVQSLYTEEGEFTGGICRLRDQEIFLVNRSLTTLEKIRVLCRELSQADLSRTFVLPALRERIMQCDLDTSGLPDPAEVTTIIKACSP